MELSMPPEPMTAVLDQLAAHHEQIARLRRAVQDLEETLAKLSDSPPADRDTAAYLANPVPKWWRLPDEQRREPLSRLRAWVEQVYRPGYGHIAATLGPCWEAHDLCLYRLDLLAQLWSALYLKPARSPGLLSAQAEYQARILPALAAQLAAETTGRRHAPGAQPAG